jgi:hypothetical protein
MKVGVLVYHREGDGTVANLIWVDPVAGKTLHRLTVPRSPLLGIFPQLDCCLVSFTDFAQGGASEEVLEVYRLSDWELRGRLPMDCRAHFNVAQRWSPFLPSPDPNLIYVYKARTLGDHLAEDSIGGLRLAELEFAPWTFRVPECVAGWSVAAGPAHAQMLFVADGVEVGRLPTHDLEQKLAFWLGPEAGMGPCVKLGPRPLAHSDLGHARAVLCAPKGPLSVVVCNDGTVHLIDPVQFRHVEKQKASFSSGHAMPLFAAQIDADGRLLYVGTASHEARHQGLSERLVVHDLTDGRRQAEWLLPEPFGHMALTDDGQHLCGAGLASGTLWVLHANSGRVTAKMPLGGAPRYLMPVSDPLRAAD